MEKWINFCTRVGMYKLTIQQNNSCQYTREIIIIRGWAWARLGYGNGIRRELYQLAWWSHGSMWWSCAMLTRKRTYKCEDICQNVVKCESVQWVRVQSSSPLSLSPTLSMSSSSVSMSCLCLSLSICCTSLASLQSAILLWPCARSTELQYKN